jgi:hypothetical protein
VSVRALVFVLAACILAGAMGCGGQRGEAPKVSRRGDSGPIPMPEEPAWKEGEITLPPYPRDQDLIPFEPTGQTTNRFYVDGSALTVDPDRVVRFPLVIRSAEGTRTVSYSGVNCKPGEWKDYAYGLDGNRWERVADPNWRQIRNLSFNNHQYTLAAEFLCYGGVMSGGPRGDAKSIVRRLRHPPAPESRVPPRYD